MVVCGSGPRAVVTTASYEARKLAGIHSAMPAAMARRRLPDAIYLPPDFTAYREASREVMEILRRNAETVEVVGLDEAYVDLTGLFSPKATMRRIATEIREETGLDLLDRDLREPHAGQDHQRAGQAGGARRPLAARRRWSASPPSPRAWSPASGRRPSQARADGNPHAGRARGPRARTSSSRPSGRATGAWLRAAPGSRTKPRSAVERETKSQSAETTFDTDVADRGQLARLARRARRGALPPPALARPAGAHDRDQGPPRRLDQRHPLAHRWSSRPTTRRRSTEVALDLLRAYSPPRPVRLLGVRVAASATRSRPPRPPEPQMRLSLPAASAEAATTAGEHDAEVGEAERCLGRLGEVEVAAGRVGAAVDDRHGQRAAAVAELDLGPAGQRLVGDAERPRLQGSAAGERAAVEAGAVVGGGGGPVDGDAACGAAPSRATRRSWMP